MCVCVSWFSFVFLKRGFGIGCMGRARRSWGGKKNDQNITHEKIFCQQKVT